MTKQFNTGSFEALRYSDAELAHLVDICFSHEHKKSILAIASLHLELSRIHRITSNATIATIRLRWWLDAIAEIYDSKPIRKHPVALCLSKLAADHNLSRGLLDAKIESHSQDFDGLRTLSWAEASRLFASQRGNLFRLFLEATAEKSLNAHQAANHLGVAYGVWRAVPGLGCMDDIPWLSKADCDPNWVVQAMTHLDELDDILSPKQRWMKVLARYLHSGLMLVAENKIPHAVAMQKTAAFGLWRHMMKMKWLPNN